MSSYIHTHEFNKALNNQRSEIQDAIEYLKSLLPVQDQEEQDQEDQEDQDQNNCFIKKAIETFEAANNILSECYLSSGYRYDDDDPRNIMDQHDDGWFERERARNGTSIQDEMRSEISKKVAMEHSSKMMKECFEKVPSFGEWYHERMEQIFESFRFEEDDMF
jgi:hypothetical protein